MYTPCPHPLPTPNQPPRVSKKQARPQHFHNKIIPNLEKKNKEEKKKKSTHQTKKIKTKQNKQIPAPHPRVP